MLLLEFLERVSHQGGGIEIFYCQRVSGLSQLTVPCRKRGLPAFALSARWWDPCIALPFFFFLSFLHVLYDLHDLSMPWRVGL